MTAIEPPLPNIFPQLRRSRSSRMRREELQIVADELLREVDAALIDTANASIASATRIDAA